MKKTPKLMIMGHAEHGKDHVCRLLKEIFGLTSISSSYFANECVVYPALQPLHGYTSLQACYEDRYAHRQEWFELIKAYNTPDGCRLAKDLFQQFNIYNGVRNIEEFESIKAAKLFDYAIWVDASERKPPESSESCTVTRENADFILSNNGKVHQMTSDLMKLIIELYPDFT